MKRIEFIEARGHEPLNANNEKFGQVVLTEGGEFVMVMGGWVSHDHPKYFVGIGTDTGFGQRVTVMGRRITITKIVGEYQ